jgi:hypothetical protein
MLIMGAFGSRGAKNKITGLNLIKWNEKKAYVALFLHVVVKRSGQVDEIGHSNVAHVLAFAGHVETGDVQ